MIAMQELHRLFSEKLIETSSLDAALTKVAWVAYKQGVKDGGIDNDDAECYNVNTHERSDKQ